MLSGRSRRARALGYAAVAALCMTIAAVMGRPLLGGIPADGVDRVSAALALTGLAGTIWSLYQGVRAWRWQETAVADLVARLVDAVRDGEETARAQLLGRHDKPIDVRFDFRPAPAHDAHNADPQGRLADVVHYYRRLHPRRMVITGAPGSGKTLLAIEIILGLLETRGADDPVPVRLSAATWSTDTAEPVQQWLVNHLVTTFDLSPASAEALVAGQRILPVIDGLDEMDADASPGYDSRAARAVEALNTYQQRRAKAELVLTCRTGQYQALEAARVWAQDAAHIELRPVDPVQARAFLTDRVLDLHRWQPVLDVLDHQPAHPLAVALSTPWRLTLVTVVYEQRHPGTGAFLRDPADLAGPGLTTADEIRDHLLSLFIPATLTTQRPAGHPPAQVHRWLGVLAAYLDDNTRHLRRLGGRTLSGTDLVLHELWPLAGARRPRMAALLLLALPWAVVAPIMLTQVPVGFAANQVLGASSIAFGVLWTAYLSWSHVWPQPSRADLTQLRTAAGGRRFVAWLGLGAVFGLGLGLVFGFVFGAILGFAFWLAVGVTGGLAVGLAAGLLGGLTSFGTVGVREPRAVIRNDLTVGLAAGVAVVLAFGLTNWRTSGLQGRPAFWFALWLGAGITAGLTGALAGTRYLALLLLTRSRSGRPLPWRLGRFLNWCYHAGLVRIAGGGYQFRHRELQDYLARHPHP